jgi:acetyl-CoA C-acetyltransferase
VGSEQLMVEAFNEALMDADIERREIGAAWLGSALDQANVGNSAIPLSTALRMQGIPVTRVENMCATGTEALRGACYAVAAGAVDIALALGVEKLKDTGYGGLPVPTKGTLSDLWMPYCSAPAGFAQLASGYQARYRLSREELKRSLAHVSWKSHQNGARSPKAHLRRPVSIETILAAPIIAEPLGVFDCCGVSDGAACAIVTTPDIARGLGKRDLITVKALQISASSGRESGISEWDGSCVPNTKLAARAAYREAGITEPGAAVADVLNGKFDADGALPCQTDGGLKCFGHPVGASGLRMVYEHYVQMMGRAGERQLKAPRLGLSHNLGGVPYNGVAAISIVGLL